MPHLNQQGTTRATLERLLKLSPDGLNTAIEMSPRDDERLMSYRINPIWAENHTHTRPIVHRKIGDPTAFRETSFFKMMTKVRSLRSYADGWFGKKSKGPTKQAINEAEIFLCNHVVPNRLATPTISLANDGEIIFSWQYNGTIMDLGLFGDGTYSYFIKTSDGESETEDAVPVTAPLPTEVIRLLKDDNQ